MTDCIIWAVIAILAAAAVRRIVKDRRAGRTGCGGSCGGCPWSGSCSGGQKAERR